MPAAPTEIAGNNPSVAPVGHSPSGENEVSESTEREIKARSKGFERPLRLRRRAAEIPQKNLIFRSGLLWNPGEDLTTDSVGNLVRSEVSRSKEAPQCGVAPTEAAVRRLMTKYPLP